MQKNCTVTAISSSIGVSHPHFPWVLNCLGVNITYEAVFVQQRYAVTFWWVTCESESQGTQKKINKYFLWRLTDSSRYSAAQYICHSW